MPCSRRAATSRRCCEVGRSPIQRLDVSGELWLFMGFDASVVDEVHIDGPVNVSFIAEGEPVHVSISGMAEPIGDPELARRLWQPSHDVLFPKGARTTPKWRCCASASSTPSMGARCRRYHRPDSRIHERAQGVNAPGDDGRWDRDRDRDRETGGSPIGQS